MEDEKEYQQKAPGRAFRRGAAALGKMLTTVIEGMAAEERARPVEYKVSEWQGETEEKVKALFGGEDSNEHKA